MQYGTIRMTQTRLVGEIEVTRDGSIDPLDAIAQMAMGAARDEMRDDMPSESTFEVDTTGTLDMGTLAITIAHDPKSGQPQFSVDQLSAMLKEARRREREAEVADEYR